MKTRMAAVLNGEPSSELAKSLSLDSRRKIGAFFTSAELARRAVRLTSRNNKLEILFDPSCGAGDLLLSAARYLPVSESLESTIELWGRYLQGCDTSEEFVRLTKARLALLAQLRGALSRNKTGVVLSRFFKNIVVADGLNEKSHSKRATWVLMNPPYGYVVSPKDCEWSAGRVTEAALFFEASLRHSTPGTRITGILPEVLRSGSRYQKWREMVDQKCTLLRVKPLGVFDKNVDINVFILDVQKKSTGADQCRQQWKSKRTGRVLGNLFEIHVGSVVPHRHKEAGARVPYLHARSVPPWALVQRIGEHLWFHGILFSPPFVVIRRTSRPGDRYRAVPTVVAGKRSVAVENHLVVCLPKDGKIQSCWKLLRHLQREEVSRWLDSRNLLPTPHYLSGSADPMGGS